MNFRTMVKSLRLSWIGRLLDGTNASWKIGSITSRCLGIEPALTPESSFSGGSKTGLEKTAEIEPSWKTIPNYFFF